nr:NADH dehydrogenase subunit 5 [Cyamus boopis]
MGLFYKMSSVILGLASSVCFLVSLTLSLENKMFLIDWLIYSSSSNSVVMTIILDLKSCIFLATVFMISSFIMVYSIYYMEGDLNQKRFCWLLISFIISMVFLIISPNMISLMLGWDGLGLTSYALVIFYQNESSANSGMITILSNRVGDSTIMLSIAWMLYKGSYTFYSFSSLDSLILLLVAISSFTKSAQVPFSAWLPAAMAAPTPVSALVHSSTLVTAGVYLVVRFSPLLEPGNILNMVLVMGLITMTSAGWVANFETDLKKVIALSTLSQLGLMFTILGLGHHELAFLHLIMHALFKSALFMGAGFVIHNTNNSQEGRFVNLFNISSPTLCLLFSCTNISLAGLPFMTGFFSKDAILEFSFYSSSSVMIFFVIVLATGLTVAYSLRAAMLISSQKSFSLTVSHSTDLNSNLVTATHFLFLLSIGGGWFLSYLLCPFLKIFVMSPLQKFSILTIIAFSAITSLYLVNNHLSYFKKTANFFFHRLVFMPFVTKTPTLLFAKMSSQSLLDTSEKGWLEEMGPSGVSKNFTKMSLMVSKSTMLVMVTQFLLAFLIIFLVFSSNCLL